MLTSLLVTRGENWRMFKNGGNMIEVKIKKERKCYATFDSYTGRVDMEFSYRGTTVIIEFSQRQWEQFAKDVAQIEFISAHHGQC